MESGRIALVKRALHPSGRLLDGSAFIDERTIIIQEVETDSYENLILPSCERAPTTVGVRRYLPESSRQTLQKRGPEKMVKKTSKVLKARTKEGRKTVRKTLGSLKSLTVQPVTKARYKANLDAFFNFLQMEGLQLPYKRDHLDPLISDYLEHLWLEGEGRVSASTFLTALQDYDPKIRGKIPGAWKLMRTWNANELPTRAPPLPETVLKTMVGWAVFHEHYAFGLSLLVAFHTMLRTGELLALQGWQIHMFSPTDPAVINLGLTKSGKRQGTTESVTLTDLSVLKWLWEWKRTHPPTAFITDKPHVWREMFNTCVNSLKLQEWEFKPYSLRRGGATSAF